MNWLVEWTDRAKKDLKPLDRPTKERILEAVGRLAETDSGDVKRLLGVDPPEFRPRVGNWRLFFRQELEAPAGKTLIVLAVRPRGNAYRDK